MSTQMNVRIKLVMLGWILLALVMGKSFAANTAAAGSFSNPVGAGTYNDSVLSYGGNWNTSSGAGKYNNDDHYSVSVGATAQVSFSGTQIKLFAAKASHHGIAAVKIDNGSEVSVDLFSAARQDQTLIYSSPLLAKGVHTIEVRVTGAGNAQSSDVVVALDRFDVIDEGGPAVPSSLGAGTYDDTALLYGGSWNTSNGPAKFNSGDHYSQSINATASASFTGTQVKLTGAKASHHGIAGFRIDNEKEVLVDLYSAVRQDQALIYASPVLPKGLHTITVRVTGGKNAQSSDTVIALDRLDIVNTAQLTLSVAVTGVGTVNSSPAGIHCGSSCSAGFNQDASVTLTASPEAGQVFSNWSGACSGNAATCTLTMNAAKSVTANFVPAGTGTFALNVSVTGSGKVTSSPSGINCSTACSANFSAGTSVALAAAPAAGYVFSAWGGACIGNTTTCTVSMNAARSVTASFKPVNSAQFMLSVAVTGSGTVSSSPTGINCGSVCNASFNSGTNVTLTASPASGYAFKEWGGACAGNATTCTVPMSAAKSVAASFKSTSTGSIKGLHVVGNRILNDQDLPVVIHGVNKSGTEYHCIHNFGIFDPFGSDSVATIQLIKGWAGVNAVRVPMNESCWLGINGVPAMYSGTNYQAAIKTYVDRLTLAGLIPILELHWTAPGNQQATGQQPMLNRDHSVTFWSQVANMFKDNSAVIFDPHNEPFPDNNSDTNEAWRCWKDGGTCGGIGFQAAGMQEIVNAIRTTGASNIIMLGGVMYSNSLTQWLSHKPSDPLNNLAASWHMYGGNLCANRECWDQAPASVAKQLPLIAGEFGEHYDGKHCTSNLVATFLDWMDSKNASYLAWTWNAWGDCLSLINDTSTGSPTNWGTFYKGRLGLQPSIK